MLNVKRRLKKFVPTIIINALLLALLVVVLYPFIIAFTGSFKANIELLTSSKILPEQWDIGNYITAWTKSNFARYTWNSVWYTVCHVLVTVLTASCNGYVFARGEFRGKKLIFGAFTSTMFIALGTSSLYPTLQIMNKLGLSDSLWGLVVRDFFMLNIANVYLVRGFINQLPKGLDEAATIDGCSYIGIFFRIILPLLKPMIATLAVLSFSVGWNDYLWPMIVTMGNPDAQPLSVGLQALKTSGAAAAQWNIVLAGSMISAVPMTIVYIIFNKYFVKGIAAGAVKG